MFAAGCGDQIPRTALVGVCDVGMTLASTQCEPQLLSDPAPAGRALASMDSGSYDDTDGFVAGRSLDEWSEALFPGTTMRTTQKFDPDSPYSRLIEARQAILPSCWPCTSARLQATPYVIRRDAVA